MSERAKTNHPISSANRIVVFQEKAIRRAWHENEWWFSVIDVVGILSESAIPKRYWSDLKRKLAQEAGSGQPYEKIVRLKLTAPDGKQRDTDVANTETLFRIIQSIPSPKAEISPQNYLNPVVATEANKPKLEGKRRGEK